MRFDRLGPGCPPTVLLRRLARRAAAAGNPSGVPAALTGSWFGSRAVIAPALRALPVTGADAFDARTAGLGPSAVAGAPGGAVGGGWIGYRGYPDLVVSEPGRQAERALPEAAGGWTDSVFRLDDAGVWWFESLTGQPPPTGVRELIAEPRREPRPAERRWEIDWIAPDRVAHQRGVRACLDAIRAGEVYQACVCGRFTGTYRGAPLDFFADAVTATAPARAAFVAGDGGAVASLSPESFLRRHGDVAASSPVKGTSPIGSDPVELRQSVKDVAENVMIVDLVRNDLGHVAVPGSVTVTELLAVRPAPGVWHLVSTVSAELVAGTSDAALVEACFPPASVTGTPKLRARELLRRWESSSRGVYCGTVGMASPLAGLDLNVAIRTVEFACAPGSPDSGTVALGVGGGITVDSDPAAEWQECLDKASSIIGLSGARRRGLAANAQS